MPGELRYLRFLLFASPGLTQKAAKEAKPPTARSRGTTACQGGAACQAEALGVGWRSEKHVTRHFPLAPRSQVQLGNEKISLEPGVKNWPFDGTVAPRDLELGIWDLLVRPERVLTCE